MKALVAAMLTLVALAGCSDSTPAPVEEPTAGYQDVEVSAELGAISGIVVDAAIVPQAGITLTLVGHDLTATSDDGGAFVFADLVPGVYFIEANGTGYTSVQATAEVVAGEVSQLQMVVQFDASKAVYHETIAFRWFDSAGVTLVDFTVDLISRLFLDNAVPAQCDECYFEFEASQAVETMIIEAVWEDGVSHPAGATSYYWNVGSLVDVADYEDDYFTSPGRAELADNRFGQTMSFYVSMAADETWITVDQEAELFVTMFYNGPAPAGWSFVGA